jgi:hypothetical protein
MEAEDTGDGGGAGRSCLDDSRMEHDASRSAKIRHHRFFQGFRFEVVIGLEDHWEMTTGDITN